MAKAKEKQPKGAKKPAAKKPDSQSEKPTAGRPLTYSREIADEILALIASGYSIKAACASQERFPTDSTFRGWVIDDVDGIAARSARARDIQVDSMADDCLQIGDDGRNDWMLDNDPDNPGYRVNGEAIQRSKLRIDTRMRLIGKWAKAKYGDKVDLNHGVQPGNPLAALLAGLQGSAIGPVATPPAGDDDA